MPSTVRRNPAKTGLVLLSSNVTVADDGFVSIPARWLAPAAGLSPNDFQIDSEWPLFAAPLPTGMPQVQAGPFLISRNIVKENGLTFVETQYVSAVAPLRIAMSVSSSRQSFSGYAEDKFGDSESLSFDYLSASRTYSYAIVGNVPIEIPGIAPGAIYNLRSEGKRGLVLFKPSKTITGTRDVLGRVTRFTLTATSIYEQADPERPTNNIHDSTPMLFNNDNLIYSYG